MTKKELILFLDGLVDLASVENRERAILVKEKFISDFEKSYGYVEKAGKGVSHLPPRYIEEMPVDVQEEIREQVIAALTKAGECTSENVERAMHSTIRDLENLIDVRKYEKRMEEESRKKAEQNRRGGR